MKSEIDQLAVLRRLKEEGQISDREYEDLTEGLVSPTPVPDEPREEPVEDRSGSAGGESSEDDVGDGVIADESAESPERLLEFKFREDLSVNYLGSLFIAAIVLLGASSFGWLSWAVGIPAIIVLLTTLFQGWRMVTVAGAVLVAVMVILGVVMSATGSTPDEPVATVTIPPQDSHPPIPGSLGIYMDQIPDLWNTVDAPPRITKGLTRYNESGEYDTFLYRFGEWGRVAGAYDPDNEAVYALLITGGFSGPATDQLYLHLCYVVAPYSQECIDSYYQEGLDGGTLEDFTDVPHEAEWALGDHTWRLEIDQNVMTIRVYGADAA